MFNTTLLVTGYPRFYFSVLILRPLSKVTSLHSVVNFL